MSGEAKKLITKSSTVSSNVKPQTSDNSENFKTLKDEIYGVGKSAFDGVVNQKRAQFVAKAAPFIKDVIKYVAPVETAMVKNAGTVLNAVGKTAGVASKVIPIVGGGIPSAIQAVAGDGTWGASQLRKKGYIDGMPPEQWAQAQKEQRMRTQPKKNMMTIKMGSTTVKKPAYSGQSVMGKALMASAKRKV